jgi:H/ACA ribonucleoprotein complex subunit 2
MAKDKKTKEESTDITINPENLSLIAHPLADKKLTKKLLKTVKKGTRFCVNLNLFVASKSKHVKRGVKEVVKAIRKGEKGLVVLAGDISPIDVISHFPVMCEEGEIPYCYVYSKQALGEAALSKRPTSVMMVLAAKKKGAEYEEAYDSCVKEITGLPILPSALC